MDIHGYQFKYISMDIHGYPRKNGMDMDMDMDGIFHLHGKPTIKPGLLLNNQSTSSLIKIPSFGLLLNNQSTS